MGAAELQVGARDRPHADEVVGTAEEGAEARGKGLPAAGLEADRRGDHLLLGDEHLEEAVGVLVGEALRIGRVADLGVERDHPLVHRARPGERVAVGAAGGDLLADLIGRALDLDVGDLEGARLGRRSDLHPQRTDSAELGDRRLGVGERLAVLVRLVLDRLDPGALLGAGEDHGGLLGRQGMVIGFLDRGVIVAVDLVHVPAAGAGAGRERCGVPLVHGRAALAEPVDVDDRDQVPELGLAGVLEGLPHRALRQLRVPAEDPDPKVRRFEPGAGERDADRDRQALAERAGRDVDPGDLRGRVALHARAVLAEAEQLLVVDRAGRFVEGVEQRRSVALGEDEVVVRGVVGSREVVAEVIGEEHRHQVGSGHRGGRVPGAGRVAGADRVHAKLPSQLVQLLAIGFLLGGDLVQGHGPALDCRGRALYLGAIRSRPFARSEFALVRRSPA